MREVEPSLMMNPQNEVECNAFDGIKKKNCIPKRSYRKYLKIQYIAISVVIIIAVIIITSVIIFNRSKNCEESRLIIRTNDENYENYEESRLIIRTNDNILNYDYKMNFVHFSQRIPLLTDFEVLGNKIFWSNTNFRIVSKKNAAEVENVKVIFQEERVNPTAMSVDFITNKLYVADKTVGTLIIVDIKSEKYGLCLSDLTNLQEVLLDPIRGCMFILQSCKNILRANMDGSDLNIVQSGKITTMALDIETERIYWVKNLVNIESSDYFGKKTISVRLKSNFLTIISLTIIDRQLFGLWLAHDHNNSTLWTCEIRSVGRCENHHIKEIDLHNATYLKSYSGKAKNSTYNPCSLHNGGCQHLCLLTSSVYSGRTCACYLGWQKGSDPRTCERVRDGFLFTAGDFIRIKILSVNNKTSFTDVILPTHFEAGKTIYKETIDFEYNSIRKEFYWSDVSSIFKKILIQGGKTVTVQVSEPDYVIHNLAMDWVSGNMYYSKCSQNNKIDHKIMVFSIAKPIYQSTLLSFEYRNDYRLNGCPHSIVVDPIQGSLYFSVSSAGRRYLYKSTISGTSLFCIKNILLNLSYEYRVLAMDHRQNVMYQIRNQNGWLESIVLSSSYPSKDVYSQLGNILTIDVLQEWLYLTTPNSIWKADKITGNNLTQIWPPWFHYAPEKVSGVRGINPDVEAAYERNFCIRNNGGCQQLCFSAPTKTCNCSNGQTVQNDGSCFKN